VYLLEKFTLPYCGPNVDAKRFVWRGWGSGVCELISIKSKGLAIEGQMEDLKKILNILQLLFAM